MLSGSGDSKGVGHHGPIPANQQSYMAALQQQQLGMGGATGPMGVGPKGQVMMPSMHPMHSPHHYSAPPSHHPGMGAGMPPSGFRSYRAFSKPMMDQYRAQMYAYKCLSERKPVPDQMLHLITGRYGQVPPTDPHRLSNPSLYRYPPRPQSNSGTSTADWLGALGYGYGPDSSSYEPVPNVTVSSSSVIPTLSNQSTTTPDLKLPQPIPPPTLPQPTSLSRPPSDTLAVQAQPTPLSLRSRGCPSCKPKQHGIGAMMVHTLPLSKRTRIVSSLASTPRRRQQKAPRRPHQQRTLNRGGVRQHHLRGAA